MKEMLVFLLIIGVLLGFIVHVADKSAADLSGECFSRFGSEYVYKGGYPPVCVNDKGEAKFL